MKHLSQRGKKPASKKTLKKSVSLNSKPYFQTLEYSSEKRLLHPIPADWLASVKEQAKKHLPAILQGFFLIVGGLLIIAFAFLIEDKPQNGDLYLLSPLTQKEAQEQKIKKEYSYKLIWADNKRLVFKETTSSDETLKLVNLSTNITQTIISGKRNGFAGFTDTNNLLFLEDNEGLGRFTVSKFNLLEKTITPLFTFQGPKSIGSQELDYLISVSPDKTKLAITHESGLVIYTLSTEKENTVLENKDCEKQETCVNYHKPLWLSDTQLIVYQSGNLTQTPLIVNLSGNITAVLSPDLSNIALSKKGLPLVAQTGEGISVVDPKKTTLILRSEGNTKFSYPVFLGERIVVFRDTPDTKELIRVDKSGKKILSLKEFTTSVTLSDLTADPLLENIYFLTTVKDNLSVSVTFYKMGTLEEKPISFYSISKNL